MLGSLLTSRKHECLDCQKLLGLENGYTLPTVIWQNNQAEQTWEVLDNFGHDNGKHIQLGEAKASIAKPL